MGWLLFIMSFTYIFFYNNSSSKKDKMQKLCHFYSSTVCWRLMLCITFSGFSCCDTHDLHRGKPTLSEKNVQRYLFGRFWSNIRISEETTLHELNDLKETLSLYPALALSTSHTGKLHWPQRATRRQPHWQQTHGIDRRILYSGCKPMKIHQTQNSWLTLVKPSPQSVLIFPVIYVL